MKMASLIKKAKPQARRLWHRLMMLPVRALAPPLARIAGKVRRRPASLWTGAPIINMAVNARAERLLGVASKSLVYGTYFITSAFDIDLSRPMTRRAYRLFLPYLTLFWALVRFDRFHFYCDYGLLPQPAPHIFSPDELSLYKKTGKQVFFWTYGSDVRTKKTTEALGPYNCCMECPDPGRACVCDEELHAQNYAALKDAATGIFSMGDMIEYTPGSINDLFFWPVDLGADGGKKYAPSYPDPDAGGPVRIVHAPNHRHYKGTRFIIAAVAELQKKGLPVELVLVEKVPNQEALEIYRTADLVIDQCIIGFHGYFALEAMAMGKPVMCYIRKPDQYLLFPGRCPMLSARADELVAVIADLVADRKKLSGFGKAGRRYIEEHHSLEAFSKRLARAYRSLGVEEASGPENRGGK